MCARRWDAARLRAQGLSSFFVFAQVMLAAENGAGLTALRSRAGVLLQHVLIQEEMREKIPFQKWTLPSLPCDR